MGNIKIKRDFEFVGYYTDNETNAKIELTKSKNFFNAENALIELIRESIKVKEQNQPEFFVVRRMICEPNVKNLLESFKSMKSDIKKNIDKNIENINEILIERIYFDKEENIIKCSIN